MTKRGELYRIPSKGKLAGVCAGFAEYFGIEVWLVRIIFISAVLLTGGPFFVVAYIACWFILDKKTDDKKTTSTASNYSGAEGKGWRNEDEEGPIEVKTKIWQAGEPPRQAARDIQTRYEHIEARLRGLEKYVTSQEFQLNREISRL